MLNLKSDSSVLLLANIGQFLFLENWLLKIIKCDHLLLWTECVYPYKIHAEIPPLSVMVLKGGASEG